MIKKNNDEINKTYAALKLIENLFKQGKLEKHIFMNILKEYRDTIDITQYKCYT